MQTPLEGPTVAQDAGTDPAQKYFFMHIAKTAGSYVNHVLSQAFGDDLVAHCEAAKRLDPEAADWSKPVWSGHVYLQNWLGIERRQGWKAKRLTILREPVSQLASHILWLDHYALPGFRDEYRRLDEATRDVVDAVGQTDLSSGDDIDRLLTLINGRGVQYFDNCQARYFIARSPGIGLQDPLHLGLKPRLLQEMRRFSLIGIGEEMDRFIAALGAETGATLVPAATKVNEAKAARTIDTDNPLIRRVLSKRLTLDMWLYRHVKAQWATQPPADAAPEKRT